MRCILLTCLCRSLYSVLLASVISFSVICVLWQRCGWQAFTWVMRQGILFICCRGLPVELRGTQGISVLPRQVIRELVISLLFYAQLGTDYAKKNIQYH